MRETHILTDWQVVHHFLLTLSVVSLGPVVPGSGLAEHEVVRPEDLAEGPGPDGVHGAGLQVHQDGLGEKYY